MLRHVELDRLVARHVQCGPVQLPPDAAASVAAGIFLPMGPLAESFKLQALTLAYFPWLVGIVLANCVLITVTKLYYIRRFGWV